MVTFTKEGLRKKRHKRVRKKVFGTPKKPRLSVFRSSKHIYIQAIDDIKGSTLVAVSSLEEEIKKSNLKGKREVAEAVGKLLAKRILKKNLSRVVFDRNGYLYHGRVKALAEGAREEGLHF